ncbi:putative dead box ATP-dependent RNA helicase, partial [Fasciolopsis buskii]
CSEVLPFWITHAKTFTTELNCSLSANEISGLSDILVQRLEAIGCNKLFPVQACAVPFILRSYQSSKRRPVVRPRDLCISAPTGSGKTLAYVIPSVQLLLNRKNVFVRVLVILPVRDLAAQVYNVFKQLIQGTGLQVFWFYCDLIYSRSRYFVVQRVSSKSKLISWTRESAVPFQCRADIVVATPGRLVDHLYNTPGFSMERLRILVIDEADRVVVEEKQDWYRVLEDAVYHPEAFQFDPEHSSNVIRPLIRRKRPLLNFMHQYDTTHDITLQKILVSATLTHDPGPLKRFNLYYPRLLCSSVNSSDTDWGSVHQANAETSTYPQPVDIPIQPMVENSGGVGVFTTPPGLKECLVPVTPETRALFIIHLVRHQNVRRILCFTNARITAVRLAILLKHIRGVQASQLSAQMPPDKRQRILNAFSRGGLNVLVCTDAMARGMDIKDVECVVSYDMPPNVTTYVHRIGRTARAGQTGVAYTLLMRNQFFHFKNDLKRVGKSKIKEIGFHASQVNDVRPDYKAALKKLESAIKELLTLVWLCLHIPLSHAQSKDSNPIDLYGKQIKCEASQRGFHVEVRCQFFGFENSVWDGCVLKLRLSQGGSISFS